LFLHELNILSFYGKINKKKTALAVFIFLIKPMGNYSMTDSHDNLESISLDAVIEALLFVTPGPVTVQQLAIGSDHTQNEVEESLRHLKERFEKKSGLSLQEHKGKYQITTKPQLGAIIEKFLGLQATSRLSRAGMEALAIIAYKQPVTRPQLDDIRGVNSDGVLKSLLSKGLIEEIGRADGPGRPIIYGTTTEFLQYFGINSINDMPPLELGDEQADEIREKVFKD
jgi:segregation and condensation protein B